MDFRGQRTTIVEPIGLSGSGLHSGEPVEMRLLPARPEQGIVLRRRVGDGYRDIPAVLESLIGSVNATTLGVEGAQVKTVEHLLASLSMCRIDDVVIDLDTGEPPAMDGSAEPFVRLIERAGVLHHGRSRRVAEIVAPVSLREGTREIAIEPAPVLSVDYEIEFPACAIGCQKLSLPHLDHETFAREIAPARTFGFLADVERLHAAGLARGASLANTVVVDGERIVNEEGLRWPDEFVRHKILDLVGDLALFGPRLIGRIRVRRGGHALHHALLGKLRATPTAYRIVADPHD